MFSFSAIVLSKPWVAKSPVSVMGTLKQQVRINDVNTGGNTDFFPSTIISNNKDIDQFSLSIIILSKSQ